MDRWSLYYTKNSYLYVCIITFALEKFIMYTVLPLQTARGRDQLAAPTNYEMKSRTLDHSKRKGGSREGRGYVPARPAPTPPTSRVGTHSFYTCARVP